MLKNIVKLGELTLYSRYIKQERTRHTLQDLFWECTLTCNAACKHCGSNAEKRKYDGELTTGEIKHAFLQIARDMNSNKILINVTGGEPLMRKDLCEVMEFATDLGFHWGMTTNGILLNNENIKKLKKAKMETISISIDGIGKTHDNFRGVEGSYDTIISNIKELQKANFVKHLQVTTIFHKGNIAELEKIYDVMAGLNLTSWRVGAMDPIGRGKDNEDLLLDGTDLKKLFDFIKEKNKNGKLRITYACPGFLGIDYEKDIRDNYFYCRTGVNVASILYNGDLYVCPNVPRMENLIQGNIRKDNFAEVWDKKYKEFRGIDRTKCDECGNCEEWDYCLGGAYHTWNFEENMQNRCPYKMIQGA